jgi:hypothetical protein
MPKLKDAPEAPTDKTFHPLTNRARLLTTAQLAAWWNVSRKHIWVLTRRKGENKLPSYRMGKHRLYIYDECYYYLKKQQSS